MKFKNTFEFLTTKSLDEIREELERHGVIFEQKTQPVKICMDYYIEGKSFAVPVITFGEVTYSFSHNENINIKALKFNMKVQQVPEYKADILNEAA